MMRFLLAAIGLLLWLSLAACSADHDKPVYDTAANPEDFPQPALELINDIETGTLNDYESVVDRFATLYAEHLDLVDNQTWRDIITEFGYKFEKRADSLVVLGLPHYYRAGGLYALAAFARPEDSKLLTLKEQFEGWRVMVDNNYVPAPFLSDTLEPTFEEKIELFRRFYLADSVFQEFADAMLIPKVANASGSFTSAEIPPHDRVFLQYAGLLDGLPDSSIMKFSDPQISLVDLAVIQMQPNRYRVEAYFVSHEPIGADYAIAFRVAVPDSSLYTEKFGEQHYLPFDFLPLKKTSQWKPGELQAAVQAIYVDRPPAEMLVGMYRPKTEPKAFLPIQGSSRYLAPFDGSVVRESR